MGLNISFNHYFKLQNTIFLRVRWQENSSFANFGCGSACAICKCAVLCGGCSII